MRAKQIKKLEGGKPAWAATVSCVAAQLKEAFGVLNLLKSEPAKALESLRDFSLRCKNLDRCAIESKLDARQKARADKDWTLYDKLRDELLEMGIELRDSPEGTDWKVLRS